MRKPVGHRLIAATKQTPAKPRTAGGLRFIGVHFGVQKVPLSLVEIVREQRPPATRELRVMHAGRHQRQNRHPGRGDIRQAEKHIGRTLLMHPFRHRNEDLRHYHRAKNGRCDLRPQRHLRKRYPHSAEQGPIHAEQPRLQNLRILRQPHRRPRDDRSAEQGQQRRLRRKKKQTDEHARACAAIVAHEHLAEAAQDMIEERLHAACGSSETTNGTL